MDQRLPLVITTTLLGPGTAKLALGAIESARAIGIRDHLIIPWNLGKPIDCEDGEAREELGELAEDDRDAPELRGIMWVRPFEGESFADARNYALIMAADVGADWAITLDTDERLASPFPEDLIKALWYIPPYPVVFSARTEGYAKQRVFRLPVRGRWVGPTHETYIAGPDEKSEEIAGLTFSEVPKTAAQIMAKAERDVRILEKEFARTNDPRWAFYLGESYALLARGEEATTDSQHGYIFSALKAYRRCATLRDSPVYGHFREEGGWAMFKAARLLSELTPNGTIAGWDVLDQLILGMRVCPWMAELPYLAAHLETNDPQRRLAWAVMAIKLGRVEGIDIPRVGFSEGIALYEAPYDLAGIAYKEMGDEERAIQMWEYAKVAKALRERRGH